jgi:solute carrier family 25 protein 33/36
MPTRLTCEPSVNICVGPSGFSQSLRVFGNNPQLGALRQVNISLNDNGASMYWHGEATPKSSKRFASMREVALKMYRREGLGSFFKGLSASYWGVSEGAIQLALYEELKSRLDEKPSKMQLFFLAGFCKLTASVATYPHEVVRTRMRDQITPVDKGNLKYRGMAQSIQKIFREEGYRGLYGGLSAHLMKTVPNAAIMYVVLEMIIS